MSENSLSFLKKMDLLGLRLLAMILVPSAIVMIGATLYFGLPVSGYFLGGMLIWSLVPKVSSMLQNSTWWQSKPRVLKVVKAFLDSSRRVVLFFSIAALLVSLLQVYYDEAHSAWHFSNPKNAELFLIDFRDALSSFVTYAWVGYAVLAIFIVAMFGKVLRFGEFVGFAVRKLADLCVVLTGITSFTFLSYGVSQSYLDNRFKNLQAELVKQNVESEKLKAKNLSTAIISNEISHLSSNGTISVRSFLSVASASSNPTGAVYEFARTLADDSLVGSPRTQIKYEFVQSEKMTKIAVRETRRKIQKLKLENRKLELTRDVWGHALENAFESLLPEIDKRLLSAFQKALIESTSTTTSKWVLPDKFRDFDEANKWLLKSAEVPVIYKSPSYNSKIEMNFRLAEVDNTGAEAYVEQLIDARQLRRDASQIENLKLPWWKKVKMPRIRP